MMSPAASTPDNTSSKFWFAAVISLAFVVRGGMLLALPDGLSRDTDAYRNIAEAFRSSGTFAFRFPVADSQSGDRALVRPTAFRPPLYPLLLAVLVTDGKLLPIAVGILHLVSGVLTVAVVWIVARQWKLGEYAPVAAMLTACDPILLFQSTQVMTETLATFLLVAAVWGLTNWQQRPGSWNALFAGFLLGLACLCRPTFLPWCGLIIVSFWWIDFPGKSRMRAATLLLIGILVTLLPWGVRNYLQFGEWKFTTTHGGYTLLLGNNPSYYRFLREARWGSVWDSRELDQAWIKRGRLRDANDDLFALAAPQSAVQPADTGSPLVARNEFEDDRLAYDFARRYIREDPAMFAVSCLCRIGSLWQILPHQVKNSESTAGGVLRWLTACWCLTVFGLAATGAWQLGARLRGAPWVWGVLLCVAFTGVHTVYWSNMRMRSPVIPFLSLLAAGGIAALVRGRAESNPDRSRHES